MNARKLSNTLLSGLVTRYHAVPTVKPQTLDQHQWGVAILAIYLTLGAVDKTVLIECLLHDTEELFTGDIPFPVKRDCDLIRNQFAYLAKKHRLEDLLPEQDLLGHQYQLLKLCDTLEGLLWCAQHERGRQVQDRWVGAYNRAYEKFGESLERAYPGIWDRAQELVQIYLPMTIPAHKNWKSSYAPSPTTNQG